MGGLFGGGSTKTKVKREIPKASPEEQTILKSILSAYGIDTDNDGDVHATYQTLPELQNTLKHPYKTMESPFGMALIAKLLSGYTESPGMQYLNHFASMPQIWFLGNRTNLLHQQYNQPQNDNDIWNAIASYGEV